MSLVVLVPHYSFCLVGNSEFQLLVGRDGLRLISLEHREKKSKEKKVFHSLVWLWREEEKN